MSIWAEFEGTITLRKGAGVSIGKMLKDIWDETNFKEYHQDHNDFNNKITFHIGFNCCMDGEQVVSFMQRFKECLKGYDKSCTIDLKVTSRFIM